MHRIVERTTAGRNHRGRIDGERGGRVPFGYSRVLVVQGGDVKHVAEIDLVAAEVVRRIYRERRRKLSLREIADGLNRDGVPTPQGGQF
jgi:DNA invertase Pin-like site-specific DNA recombinase